MDHKFHGFHLSILASRHSSRKTVALEEAKDGSVSLHVSVLEVETVSSALNNVDDKVGGVGEHGLGGLRDGVEASWGGETVSATEWNVLLTGNDEDGSLGWVHAAGGTANGEELTNGHWLAGHGSDLEDFRVEVSLSEEVGLNSGGGSWGEVAINVLSGECWVQVGLGEVTTVLEEWQESAVLGETGETETVGDVWVHGGQRVALDGTERVSNVNNLLESGHTSDLSSTELVGQLLQSSDLECDLDLVDWLSVAGHANSKTVVREGSVAVLLNSLGNVRVVVVVVRKIPVRAVEANAVGQKLDGAGSSTRWSAVSGRQVVVTGEVSVLIDR